MGQHTPERLALTSQDDQVTGCANFESRYGVDAIVLYHDNAKADARRIVQCWNGFDALEIAAEEALASLDRGMVAGAADTLRAALRAATGDQS